MNKINNKQHQKYMIMKKTGKGWSLVYGVLTINKEIDWAEKGWNNDEIYDVIIEKGVTSIGEDAFFSCEYLTSVDIPESITSIGECAFNGCGSLKTINIPSTVMNIEDGVFGCCSSLEAITVEENNKIYSSIDGVLFTKGGTILLTYPEGKKDDEYNIPESVKSIGECAFYGCASLKTINIPAPLMNIGEDAFCSCSSLEAVMVDENNKIYSSKDGVLFTKDGLTLLFYPMGKKDTEYIIPNMVKRIGESAFYLCKALSSIEIPDTVSSIGNSAFGFCDNLEYVNIPYLVKSVSKHAFWGCGSLKTINLNSVTTIGEYAFFYCHALSSIQIPDSVKYIESSAFCSCLNLTSINIPQEVKVIEYEIVKRCENLRSIKVSSTKPARFGNRIADDVPKDAVLYVPKGCKTIYAEAKGWKKFKNIEEY